MRLRGSLTIQAAVNRCGDNQRAMLQILDEAENNPMLTQPQNIEHNKEGSFELKHLFEDA